MALTELQTEFAGRRWPVFRVAMITGFLTLVTAGIYRFWMKTRLRRYYWSSVRPGGHPLEYVGEPIEKLLGFLIAVVILAFYIGFVNLILMFASFSLFQSNTIAYVASFIGVVPIWFFALYRARRYVLARTRWRGIRFALEPGAWGYAGRALVHWVLTILSLGLLWPRMTFLLEKYKTDRTLYGDLRLHQGGDFRMLYPALAHALPAAILTVASAAVAATGEPRVAALLVVTGPWLLYGIVYYRVETRRLLANHKTAGTLGLVARPRATRIAGILWLGYSVIAGLLTLFVLLIGLGIAGFFAATGADPFNDVFGLTDTLTLVVAGLTYFFVFVLWNGLGHAMITLPVWRHYAETLEITGAGDLSQIGQRDRDIRRDAEGFAEALDLGAAI